MISTSNAIGLAFDQKKYMSFTLEESKQQYLNVKDDDIPVRGC